MPLSDADAMSQIINSCGNPNNTLVPVVTSLWTAFSDKRRIDWWLQYYYTKRAALDVRLAEEAYSTDLQLQNDLEDKQSQRFEHLQEMKQATVAEIVRIEAIARARRVPVTGALTKTAPESPPYPGGPDANSPRYSGDPYRGFFGPKRW